MVEWWLCASLELRLLVKKLLDITSYYTIALLKGNLTVCAEKREAHHHSIIQCVATHLDPLLGFKQATPPHPYSCLLLFCRIRDSQSQLSLGPEDNCWWYFIYSGRGWEERCIDRGLERKRGPQAITQAKAYPPPPPPPPHHHPHHPPPPPPHHHQHHRDDAPPPRPPPPTHPPPHPPPPPPPPTPPPPPPHTPTHTHTHTHSSFAYITEAGSPTPTFTHPTIPVWCAPRGSPGVRSGVSESKNGLRMGGGARDLQPEGVSHTHTQTCKLMQTCGYTVGGWKYFGCDT